MGLINRLLGKEFQASQIRNFVVDIEKATIAGITIGASLETLTSKFGAPSRKEALTKQITAVDYLHLGVTFTLYEGAVIGFVLLLEPQLRFTPFAGELRPAKKRPVTRDSLQEQLGKWDAQEDDPPDIEYTWKRSRFEISATCRAEGNVTELSFFRDE